MMNKRERTAWGLLFLVTAAFILTPYLLTPSPYRDVRLIETRQDEHWRYITVNFVKGDCIREDVVFLGYRLGLIDDLTAGWQSLDGTEAGHDRLEGQQTLNGRLHTGGLRYEAFEIRTRHLCDGKRVDRTFIRIEANADK